MPGPFYFAWIEAPEAFDPDYHAVEDEFIYSFEMQHDEGDLPSLQLLIKNPKVGLLSRPVWAWFSWDKNWVPAEDHTPDIVPLFLGRLLGIPNTLYGERIMIELVARPSDYNDQRAAVAEALRVLPQYDPVWVSPDKWEDADTVLEGYTRLWHFDRVTHDVTTSDIVVGEDGAEEFLASEIPYGSVAMTLSQAPFRSVYVEATVKWTQRGTGSVAIVTNELVSCLNGESLIGDWPKKGASMGGGYIAKEASAEDVNGAGEVELQSFSSSWSSASAKHNPGDTISTSYSSSKPAKYFPKTHYPTPFGGRLTHSFEFGIGHASFNSTFLYVFPYAVRCNLRVSYEAARGRTEVARFTIDSNTQPVLTDPSSIDRHEIKISSNDVDVAIGEEIPIGDVSRKSFFETDRGQQSLQYLLCLGRAMLTNATRCVEVTAKIPFARAIGLTCRMNGIIYDDRLPGGQAVGKIKSYSFALDASNGEMFGMVTLASTIGYGGAVEADPGNPTYVDDGYVDPGYQMYDGSIIVLPGDNLGYEVPLFAGTDDGITFPLTRSQIVEHYEWHNLEPPSAPAIMSLEKTEAGNQITEQENDDVTGAAQAQVNAYVAAYPAWLELELKNINGKFTNDYNVTVIPLELPKQIDLEYSA